jgi:ribose transport system ATP-binding protein
MLEAAKGVVAEAATVGSSTQTTPTGYRLQLTGVSKSFGAVRALSDVTLEVPAGQIHGLIGENGAGKSTLMAIASGALVPDAGQAVVDGRDIRGDAVAARAAGLAIVRQHPALLPDLTVADNLLLGMPASMRPRVTDSVAWARTCLGAWDDRPDIDPRMRAEALNAEQQFIVELARALCQAPAVLLLDEPSEHLKAEDVDRLFRVIRELAAGGTAIVYISHRVREVRQISDRVTVLRNGVNRGTRETADLDEAQIIELIIGRSLDAQYPAKQSRDRSLVGRPAVLEAYDLSGEGFSGASLIIEPGEVVGLAGIDGNGQAQFARALAGLQRFTGPVKLSGYDARLSNPVAAVNAGIAYVPADRHREGIFPDLSVRENVMIRGVRAAARFGFVSPSLEREKSTEILKRYAVKAASPDAPVTSLSGGNQQKVVMGGALASAPRLLIADQPAQGVDVGAKIEIYNQLRTVAATGAGVLMLSSDNSELAGVCDRVVVMSRGQIVAEIAGEELFEETITNAVLRASSTRDHGTAAPGRFRRILDHDSAPVPVLLALIIILAVIAQLSDSTYLHTRNISLVLGLGAILAVAATGQGLVLMHGGFDLSIGPLMSIAPVIASYYLIGAGYGYDLAGWVFIALATLVVGLGNWLLGAVLKLNPMLASFGMWTLLDAIALILRPQAGGLISNSIVDRISRSFGPIPCTLIAAVVVAAGLELWRTRTFGGKALQAVGSDRAAAHTLGISAFKASLIAYVASALLAGLAGVMLIGQIGTGDPTAGESYVLTSIAAAVVGGVALTGGRGSFTGVLCAAVLLVQVQTATPYLGLSPGWQQILVAVVTIVAVCVYSLARRRPAR